MKRAHALRVAIGVGAAAAINLAWLQRVLDSTSKDFTHWPAPHPLVDSVKDGDARPVA